MKASFRVVDERVLRTVLWADTALGTFTALVGLAFATRLPPLLGLSLSLIVVISLVTLAYGVAAFVLAVQRPIAVPLVRMLVGANWLWTADSALLPATHVTAATVSG